MGRPDFKNQVRSQGAQGEGALGYASTRLWMWVVRSHSWNEMIHRFCIRIAFFSELRWSLFSRPIVDKFLDTPTTSKYAFTLPLTMRDFICHSVLGLETCIFLYSKILGQIWSWWFLLKDSYEKRCTCEGYFFLSQFSFNLVLKCLRSEKVFRYFSFHRNMILYVAVVSFLANKKKMTSRNAYFPLVDSSF